MQIAKEINQLVDPDLVMTPEDRFAYCAATKLLPDGVNLMDAVRFYLKHHESVAVSTKPVAALIGDLDAHMAKTKVTAKHRAMTISLLNRFAKIAPKAFNEVKTKHLQAWIDEAGPAASKQSRFAALRALYNRARVTGVLPNHIPSPLDAVSKAPAEPVDPVLIDVGHLKRVFEAVRTHSPGVLAALTLKAFAGLRTSEVGRLTFDQIDLSNRVICLSSTVTKTRRRRLVPLNDTAIAWLQAAPEPRHPKCRVTKSNFHDLVNSALDAAGVAHIPPNSLRHTCATALLAVGKQAPEVAGMLGHSVNVLESHYKGLMTADQGREYFNILPT